MTKEIIKLTATMLGLDDVVAYLSDEEVEDEVGAKKTVDDMIVFLNHVVREITKDYFTLSRCDNLLSNDKCEILFSQFSQNPVKIKAVENKLKMRAAFNLCPSCVKVSNPNEVYTITYNYTPAPVSGVDDELNLPLGLDYFVVCYGVASEYALSKLLYDEANMWQSKFVSSLEKLTTRCKERRFFARKLK